MRLAGRVVEWQDARGFGFIEPNGGGDRAFVHIRAFPRGRRPAEGTRVTYTVQRDDRQRLNAIDVRVANAAPSKARSEATPSRLPRKWIGLAALAFFALAVWQQKMPPTVLMVYGGMSLVAVLVYAADKSRAQRDAWRTPESTLHFLALTGGWPGALVAQDLFRHKRSKASFQAVFWITVVANVAALAWWNAHR
ncbi:DNA-binding protein [Lysobacter helvus]|uniref:DNA-binding protein n=2 Tax=Lysobacteraceae TaxID=32033 RepID=A0ABM7Q3X6_9GAMM|nr:MULTISPECIES: cold shock and DUF1294 domain-containing protein [Lysobacter]BCT91962.1 DNA-binding protein [Lysobacter caseinilyticus]BCT95115.1 DNA-binding protein [Lysobacter helvus]